MILVVEYWFRVLAVQKMNTISIKDILSIIVKFAEESKILRWCPTYRGVGVTLSDDNKCAKSKSAGYNVSVLADVDPVTNGIHVWRVKVW